MLPILKLCQSHISKRLHLISGRCMNNYRSIDKGTIRLSSEVEEAIRSQMPVVALESAIITHGMPFPNNFSTAKTAEQIVRENGAIPATVAVINGQIFVGLEDLQVQQLAEAKNTVKMSTRDYPFAAAKKITGGTTVAATIHAANRCGIKLMATGGIGGVHINGEESMDISADLVELSRTPIAVISSGIKSILDLDKTLEYMETLGIGLASFNNYKHLPLFYSERSGRMAPYDITSFSEAALVLNEWLNFSHPGGLLLAVPVPKQYSIDLALIDKIIHEANDEAREKKIFGKDLTPFLLEQIVLKTSGKSLVTNVALVENNVKVAAQIAVEYSKLIKNKESNRRYFSEMPYVMHTNENTAQRCFNSPVVIGGSNVDFIVKMNSDVIQPGGATNLGKIARTFGGVGRNLAEGLARLDLKPIFLSAVGKDLLGEELMASIPHLHRPGILQCPDERTATYCVVLQKSGEVFVGVGDMAIHQQISPDHVKDYYNYLRNSPMVAIDGNTPTETIEFVLDFCAENNTAVWYEPTDINRASKPFLTQRWKTLSYISPNIEELRQISAAISEDKQTFEVKVKGNDKNLEPLIEEVMHLAKPLLEYIYCVVVTLGEHGLLICRNDEFKTRFPTKKMTGKKLSAVYYKAPSVSITSVSGSGDSLAAAMMAGIVTGRHPEECIQAGIDAATFSLQSERTISETLSYNSLYNRELNRYPYLSIKVI